MNRQQVEERKALLLKWFMDVRKEFPDIKLTKVGDNIYFIGNITVGEDYYMNTWKTVPIYRCEDQKYSENHPTKADQYFLDVRISYGGSSSSEDWLLDENAFKEKVRRAFKGAINDFIAKEI